MHALGEQWGFEVDVVRPQTVESGLVASSTKVRELVRDGRLDGAAAVLGRPFHLVGEVVKGKQRGRGLGFPTANLAARNELLPRTGVYAGWLDWGHGARAAVANLGYNPTFNQDFERPTVEAHVIGADDLDLYGLEARLFFLARLREERRFDGVDALRAQIAADRDAAARAVADRAPPHFP